MIVNLFMSLYIFSAVLLSHYTWGTKYTKLAAVSFCAVVIIERLFKKKTLIEVSLQHVLFFLWLAVATFSGLIFSSGKETMHSALTVSLVFLVSIPLYMVIIDRRSLTWIGWTLVLAAILSNVVISFGIFPPLQEVAFNPSKYRFAGTLGNANSFAFVSLLGFIHILYLWKVHRHILLKAALLSCSLLLIYQIVISGSRKGFICVFIIVLVQYGCFIWNNKKETLFKKAAMGMIALSLLASFFIFFVMTSPHAYRVRNMLHFVNKDKLEKSEVSIGHRLDLISVGCNNFFKNPLIGTGLSSFEGIKLENKLFSKVGVYSHSNYIEILVSSGVLGFMLYYAMFLTSALQLYRNFKSEVADSLKPFMHFASTALAVISFYDLFAVTYYGKTAWIFLTTIFASITILKGGTEASIKQ